MGKKDKNKKKGKGAEKTAEKTEKKLKSKLKKNTGEDDIESMVKAIEDEERKRKEVKELHNVPAPSHRSNFPMCAHPDNPEIVFFGGEFYNGQKTILFNDLLFYNTKRREWSQIISPAGPPPRSSHQGVMTSQAGGQLWVFGGEYASPNETQFYHYKDLWCFHFGSKRWEKIAAAGGPSSRSGHRMVLTKRQLVVFGGFHDNLRESKYFNDVHAFDLDTMQWKKLEVVGAGPSPRSGCAMFVLADGRIVVFGGYSKEKGKKDSEKGTTHSDMFVLTRDKHDTTMSKWRWQAVKQVGNRPSVRTGMSVTVAPNNNKVFLFGGVQDVKEDDEELVGTFYNDLYTVNVENEKATWSLVELTGKKEVNEEKKKRRRKKKEEGEEEEEGDEDDMESEDGGEEKEEKSGPTTVTVEEGAFTITSTVGSSEVAKGQTEGQSGGAAAAKNKPYVPCSRFGANLAVKSGLLYLFGGMVEDGDRQFTLKDFYCLDLLKLDEWQTIIESDLKSMEWFDSDWSTDDDDDDDDDESDDSDMDDD